MAIACLGSKLDSLPLAATAAKSLQSCSTLCDPIDSSPPGSPVPGILQAETLEWVAISFSNAWKWKVKVKLLSCVWLFETPWTAAYQAPPSMGFYRQEYWSGVPLPSPNSTSYQGYICTLLYCNHLLKILDKYWVLCSDTAWGFEKTTFYYLSPRKINIFKCLAPLYMPDIRGSQCQWITYIFYVWCE